MTPKYFFNVLFCFFFFISWSQESTHLFGEVNLDTDSKSITADYNLTQITVNNPKMSFMLHEDFKVDQVYLNGKPIASSKNGRFCETCKVHTIWIDRPLTQQDTLRIAVKGDLEAFLTENDQNKPIFNAGTADKWYPVILDEPTKENGNPFAENTYAYIYSLKINSAKNEEVKVGNEDYKPSGSVFSSVSPVQNITIQLQGTALNRKQNTDVTTSNSKLFDQKEN